MSPQTDLIARLERVATAREWIAQQRSQEAHIPEVDGFGTMAKLERQLSKEHATVAAEGWYEHTTEALAAIAEWEGKL